MNDAYKILIKLEADLQGGKDVTQALKEAKTAATDLGGRYDTTRTKTDALTQSKLRLKDALKGLAFQVPVLGSLIEKFSSGLAGSIALAVGAFALIRREINAFDESLDDPSSTKSFNGWAKTQKRALQDLRKDIAITLGQMARLNVDMRDPAQLADFQRREVEARAGRMNELAAAALKRGAITPAQAEFFTDRAKVNLAAEKEKIAQAEVFNTDAEREANAQAIRKQVEAMGSLMTPQAIDERISGLKERIQAEGEADANDQKRITMFNALTNYPQFKADLSRRQLRKRIVADLNAELFSREQSADSEKDQFRAASEELNRLTSRGQKLKEIAERQAINRSFERQQFAADESNRKSVRVVTSSPDSRAALAELQELFRTLLQFMRQNDQEIRQLRSQSRNQRTP